MHFHLLIAILYTTALCASATPIGSSGKLDIRDAGTVNPVSFPANTNTVQVAPPGTDTVYHDTATADHNTANPFTVPHDTETYNPMPATRVPRAPSAPTLTFDSGKVTPSAIEYFQPGDAGKSTFTDFGSHPAPPSYSDHSVLQLFTTNAGP